MRRRASARKRATVALSYQLNRQIADRLQVASFHSIQLDRRFGASSNVFRMQHFQLLITPMITPTRIRSVTEAEAGAISFREQLAARNSSAAG